MRATKALTAINEEFVLDLPEDFVGEGSVQYGAGGLGTIVVAAKLTNNGDWNDIQITNATSGAAVANLAAAGLAWFKISAYNAIKVRKSVAGAGPVDVTLAAASVRVGG